MEKNTASAPTRKRSLLPGAISLFSLILVDQTLAVVGKRVLTLRDVETGYAVESTLRTHRPPDPGELRGDPARLDSAREALIRRALIRNYLAATGLVTTLSEDALRPLRERFRAALGSDRAAEDYLSRWRISGADLTRALEDEAYAEEFLRNHFFPGLPARDEDVRGYYEREKDRRFLGKPFPAVEGLAREGLRRERVEQELEKWFQTEMRRTEVVRLPLPPPGATPAK